jgi:hypothetical protein
MTKTLSKLTPEERVARFAAEAARAEAREVASVELLKNLPEFVKPFYKNGRVKLGWSNTWTSETSKVREWLKANGWDYHASGRGYLPRGA